MTIEQKQAIANKMIDYLADKLAALWEDGSHCDTYDEFGEEVTVINIEETIAEITERVMANAKNDVQLILPLVNEHHLELDRLQRFVEPYCQQVQKEVEESCEMEVRSSGEEND